MLQLREFCHSCPKNRFPQFDKVQLSDEEWDCIEEISKILEPFAHLTTMMQKQTISLSDFFGGWAKVEMKLQKFHGSNLQEKLIFEMAARKEALFNNSVLNAAVFLDPRYQKFMPEQNKQNAIRYLENLYGKMETIRRNNNVPEPTAESTELETYLGSVYGVASNCVNTNENTDKNQQPEETIRTKLEKFIGTSISIDECVFDYWEKNKILKPELYRLASVIHAVPPTQTTVERAFSALALILTPLRTNLFDTILENILLLRLNREIFENIFEI